MAFDVANNPFAVLSAVAAPAILTNACSVLALGTANRMARVVDRTRAVMAAIASGQPGRASHEAQMVILRVRAKLLLRALRFFYSSLAMFAATALTAIVGSALVAYDLNVSFHLAAIFGFIVGTGGVLCIVAGCGLMVRETQLAVETLTEEHGTVFAGEAA